jgi:hypothetical protein
VEAFKLRDNQDYFVPNAQVNALLDAEQDNHMTVSGIFRTMNNGTSTPQFANNGFSPNALPPPSFNDPFDAFPVMPEQQYNDSYSTEYDGYNEQPFSTNGRSR